MSAKTSPATSHKAAPPNNASSGTRHEASIFAVQTWLWVSRVHSKALGFCGRQRAPARRRVQRAPLRSERAAAGLRQACAACCIRGFTGRRTMPRGWSAQPGVSQRFFPRPHAFPLRRLADDHATVGVNRRDADGKFHNDGQRRRIKSSRVQNPMAAPEARLVF